jgi:predicted alpha/beta hydrolase
MTFTQMLDLFLGLIGSRNKSPRPEYHRYDYLTHSVTAHAIGILPQTPMDRYILAAVVMLAVWAGVTFTTEAPGWIHLLLTAGVALLIGRIVARNTPAGPTETKSHPKK